MAYSFAGGMVEQGNKLQEMADAAKRTQIAQDQLLAQIEQEKVAAKQRDRQIGLAESQFGYTKQKDQRELAQQEVDRNLKAIGALGQFTQMKASLIDDPTKKQELLDAFEKQKAATVEHLNMVAQSSGLPMKPQDIQLYVDSLTAMPSAAEQAQATSAAQSAGIMQTAEDLGVTPKEAAIGAGVLKAPAAAAAGAQQKELETAMKFKAAGMDIPDGVGLDPYKASLGNVTQAQAKEFLSQAASGTKLPAAVQTAQFNLDQPLVQQEPKVVSLLGLKDNITAREAAINGVVVDPPAAQKNDLAKKEASSLTMYDNLESLKTVIKENPDVTASVGKLANTIQNATAEVSAYADLANGGKPVLDQRTSSPADVQKKLEKLGVANATMQSLVVDLAYAKARLQSPGVVTDKDFDAALAAIVPAVKNPQLLIDMLSGMQDRASNAFSNEVNSVYNKPGVPLSVLSFEAKTGLRLNDEFDVASAALLKKKIDDGELNNDVIMRLPRAQKERVIRGLKLAASLAEPVNKETNATPAAK